MKLLHNHFFPIRPGPIIHIYSLLSKVVNVLLTLHLGKVETSTIPGNKSQVISTISQIQTRLPEDTKWSIRKSSTGSNNRWDFILSQIMDILEIVNKGLGRMKRTFVPALISQQNFASLIRNIFKTPISLNKQFRASANHYDQHYNVD